MASQQPAQQRLQRTSRSRLMENAREIYSCECGKKYLTFSALYLHVKIKHQQRLSTKKTEQNHRLFADGSGMLKVYFLKPAIDASLKQSQNSALQTRKKSTFFREILQKYRQQTQLGNPASQTKQRGFLALLEGYVEEIGKQLDEDDQLPADLAYYFNEFTLYYLPRHFQAQGDEAIEAVKAYVQEMMVFWQWLKAEGATEVELSLHELYANSAASCSP